MVTSTRNSDVTMTTPANNPNANFFSGQRFREELTGWLFVSPAVLIIGLFGIFPIGYAFYMSLHRWRLRQGRFFCMEDEAFNLGACFENYTDTLGDWTGVLLFAGGFILTVTAWAIWTQRFRTGQPAPRVADRRRVVHPAVKYVVASVILFAAFYMITYGWGLMMAEGNESFLNGLIYTFYYAVGSIPLQIGLGLVLAYVLYQNLNGKQLYRMIYFIPYVTPAVAAAVVFRIVFSPRDSSLANQLVVSLGGESLRWLQEPEPFINVLLGTNFEGFLAGPSLAMVSIIVLGVWQYTGYNAVIFLAGLGNIPGDLYEAARVDGANEWTIFRHITLPLLSPITFYLTILGFIGTFKAFNTLYVMRDPAALKTTDTASIVVFDTFFRASRYGEAAAQAIILMIIIVAITQFQRQVLEKRVFYG